MAIKDQGVEAFFQGWEKYGIFDYVLPFVFTFVIIYALLAKIKLFNEKRSNILLALVIGLIAASTTLFVDCFSEIVYKLMIAAVVLLVMFLILGIFGDPHGGNKTIKILFGITAAIAFIVIILTSYDECGIVIPAWLKLIWPYLLGALALAGLLYPIIKSGAPTHEPGPSSNTRSNPPDRTRDNYEIRGPPYRRDRNPRPPGEEPPTDNDDEEEA